MTEIDTDKLAERLRALDYYSPHPNTGRPTFRNPDGPEAATAILAMAEENKRLREIEAVASEYIENHDKCEPWRNNETSTVPYGALVKMKDALTGLRRALGKDKA